MIVIPDVAGGIRGLLKPTAEGLVYQIQKRNILYPWETITNIFRWRRFNVLTVIDKDGKTSTGFVFADRKYGRPLNQIDYICKIWEDTIQQKSERTYFEYPAWCRREEYKLRVENVFWGLTGGLVIIGIALLALRENSWEISNIKEDWPIVFAFLLGLFGLMFGVLNLIERQRKKLSEITVGENNLKVVYDDGSSKQFDLTQVRKHNFAKHRYKGDIIFKDRSKLEHLERVNYWPILREHMLSKLEQKE